jgi:hypothetical protein
MSKKPIAKDSPSFSKSPRIDQTFVSHLNQKPSWQLHSIDFDGTWGWETVTKEVIMQDIWPKLRDFESMFWRDIFGRNNHEIPVYTISKEAQRRLVDLKHIDLENIVSLRLTGTQRIWGIRNGNILRILWWDPDHTVCPSHLKHT